MAIDSHFYDTVPGEGINEVEWAQSAASRGLTYGVTDVNELLCTAHPSTPYAVNISPAPSGFWGHGVWDTSDAIETIVVAPPANQARRFDLIVARRDWTPTGGGPTVLRAVQGSASRAIPSARETTPGEVDDQPTWLVEWLGGQTQPQSITDLRCFGGNGGMMANDRLALEYLKKPGASVRIGSVTWTYQVVGNQQWDWVGGYLEYQPLNVVSSGTTAWTTEGTIGVEVIGNGRRRVTVDMLIRRTTGQFTLGTSFVPVGTLIPSQARGDSVGKYLPIAVSGGGQNVLAMGFLNTSSGIVSIRGIDSFLFLRDSVFSVNCFYYI